MCEVPEEFLEEYSGFHARQISAKAQVDTMTEGHVRIGVTRDIKIHRIRKDVFIEIGRAVQHHHPVALLNRLPANMGVTGSGATKVVQGAGPAQHFLNRQRQLLWIVLQLPVEFRSPEQFVHAAADKAPGGLIASHGELHEQSGELHLRHLVPFHLLVDQQGNQVVAALILALTGQAGNRRCPSPHWPG